MKMAGEVADALAAGRGVVALESTIIAHGFPHPHGAALARELEHTVRDMGATPATIAVIDGVICVGLDTLQLARLADPTEPFEKAAALDLAMACAAGRCAATTVSATCAVASLVGIRVFATGGIGGVHRGGECDVSSDLAAIAEASVAVVSAGAKAILDLPRTLEYLETLGVPVLGYGTDTFPGFYHNDTGLPVRERIDDVGMLAEVCRARWEQLGQGGIVVANPVPNSAALPAAMVAEHTQAALDDAATRGIRGKALTPHLLAYLAESTGQASVATNRALAVSNAALGARLAVALGDSPSH